MHFSARKSYRLVAVKGLRIIRDGKPRTATLTFTQLLSSGFQRSGQCGSAYSLAQIPQVAPRHEVTTTRRGREGEGGVPVVVVVGGGGGRCGGGSAPSLLDTATCSCRSVYLSGSSLSYLPVIAP